ncbi:MAG: type I-F CRISPR-associated endonuclease Cas1 [Azospirillum sp.]|nr:type I-F CRISPR-associated endonuclease Cas1 [Azospirillum sp.]
MKTLIYSAGDLTFLERSRIVCDEGTVRYIPASDDETGRVFNIPYKNTAFIVLGPGCSITTEAMRVLARSGVCVGFSAGDSSPIYCGVDSHDPSVASAPPDESGGSESFQDRVDMPVASPLGDYRKTHFLQRIVKFWHDDAARLRAAKKLQEFRANSIVAGWKRVRLNSGSSVQPSETNLEEFRKKCAKAQTIDELLGFEGEFTRSLYHRIKKQTGFPDFKRIRGSASSIDDPNRLLDIGNHFAYGLASTVLWTLGIPASLSIMHGKTRPGGLVFDLADTMKDAIVLPSAFVAAAAFRDGKESELDTEKTIVGFRRFLWRNIRDADREGPAGKEKGFNNLFDAIEGMIRAGESCA